MANNALALNVATPEINPVAQYEAGQDAAQTSAMRSAMAQQGLETIGSMAFGVMGGKLDGQADPQMWEQSLDALAKTGFDVNPYRGRADLAPIIAKASVNTLGQLQIAQNERELDQRIAEFEFQVSEALKPKAPDLPAGVDEYNWYAEQERAAGRQPLSFLEFEQAKKGGGFSVTMPDGTVVQMGGGKPLTESQSKDTVFATRAEGALSTLNEFGSELTNPVARAVEGDPTGVARGTMQSPNFQKAQQAGLEFLQAILRKDTGAAITKPEQEEYGRVYLEQPGDSPEVIEQKRQSRLRAVEALKAGMPPHAILAQEKALANSGSAAGGEWVDLGDGIRIRPKGR